MSAEREQRLGVRSLRLMIRSERASAQSDIEGRLLVSLRHGGLGHALRTLNQRTRFRFTGLYRADDSTWHNVGLVDRENPALTLHCDLGLLFGRTTMTRVAVPVCDVHSRTIGMLCHFDYRPRVVSHPELLILEGIGPSLACYVPTPHRAAAARVPWMRRRALFTT